jgi:peptidoglycan hydrolase FlgJ
MQALSPLAVNNTPIVRDEKAWATAQDFESVLLGQLTNIMFETAPHDGPLSGGAAEDTWRGMMAEQVGKQIARGGGIGLASSVYDQIIRLQSGK